MTELNQTVERIVDTKLEDQIEVRSSAFLGEPTVHMDVTTACMEMSAADARELAAALIEVADVADPANPVTAPPVTVTTLPHDDLIFLGVKA